VTRVLVIGVPRSGTTWVARVLGQMEDVTTALEPDNQVKFPFAFRAKRGLAGGLFPSLRAGEEARDYARLWKTALNPRPKPSSRVERARRLAARRAFNGAAKDEILRAFAGSRAVSPRLRLAEALAVPERPRASASHVVAKSVYAGLAAEWIAEREGAQVIVVARNLLNVLSSWVTLGWIGTRGDDELERSDPAELEKLRGRYGAPAIPYDGSGLARTTWLLAFLALAMEADARRNGWTLVQHEEVARRPERAFRGLAAEVGLRWDTAADAMLASDDRPGRGFELTRVRAGLQTVWRDRLTSEQVDEIATSLEAFHEAGATAAAVPSSP
jgi:hypothetical protein